MSSRWSKRDQVKRRFKQADHALETALMYLLDCLNDYDEGGYEQHTVATDGLMELIQICRAQLESIRKKL